MNLSFGKMNCKQTVATCEKAASTQAQRAERSAPCGPRPRLYDGKAAGVFAKAACSRNVCPRPWPKPVHGFNNFDRGQVSAVDIGIGREHQYRPPAEDIFIGIEIDMTRRAFAISQEAQ